MRGSTSYAAALVILTLVLNLWQSATAAWNGKLQFVDGKFKVIQLTDIHLGESDARDAASLKVVASVLSAEPDVSLVVLSGDMVSGYMNKYSQKLWFEARYFPLIDLLRAAGVPHAVILGNHDAEGLLDRVDVISLDARSPGSLTRVGPEDISGAGNYWLNVASEHSETAALRLWFLDSLNRGCGGAPGWGCVRPPTVAWLQETMMAMHVPPASAAFIHIPVPEFIPAWNRGRHAAGTKGEHTCCPSCNSLAFNVLREHGVTAIYSGHDHDNDFSANWRGVRLAYGRKSGYGGYGPSGGRKKGARVIVFKEGQPALHSETYLRLEDGSSFDQPQPMRLLGGGFQWLCESGIPALQYLFGEAGKIRDVPGVRMQGTMLGGCQATMQR